MRVLTVLTFVCFIAAAFGQSHHLVVGQANYGDVILYRITEHKYGFPFIVRTSTIEYSVPGHNNFGLIRAIDIKDNWTDGTGGYATILAGGVGEQFVKIQLKSQRGNGFKFTVTIYGRY
ncbi:unnamed protein product, partial [Brenthis ino]